MMTTMCRRVCLAVCLVGLLFTATTVAQCIVPVGIQGTWDVMDSTRTTVEFTVTIGSSSLSGITFWDKTLLYDCFLQQGDYYVYKSEVTSLFDLYNVHIYFCWYLQSFSSDTYRLYELTDKVLYTVEERAKAYLNSTTPTVNDVCEVAFDSALIYKEMQYVVYKSGSTDARASATAMFACLWIFFAFCR